MLHTHTDAITYKHTRASSPPDSTGLSDSVAVVVVAVLLGSAAATSFARFFVRREKEDGGGGEGIQGDERHNSTKWCLP